MQDGKWVDQWQNTKKTGGHFIRKASQFRNWITSDGRPGSTGYGGFKAEADRYHLYVSYACPWAHRTLILRSLKGLENIISLSVVHWYMAENGWTFQDGDGVIPDSENNAQFMYQIYVNAKADYSGSVTVPVLWDKHLKTIVSNESSEIIRMFNSAFEKIGAKDFDFYPKPFRDEIDTINARVYATLNNGVYKSGFATTQAAYEDSVVPLFDTLDWLEKILSKRRYLTGTQITEADWRLFTTLVRFDHVYFGHFKCNIRRIADYPHLSNYVRDLYQCPGVASTVHMGHIKDHYYASHTSINPTAIVPLGPNHDLDAPHNRADFN